MVRHNYNTSKLTAFFARLKKTMRYYLCDIDLLKILVVDGWIMITFVIQLAFALSFHDP